MCQNPKEDNMVELINRAGKKNFIIYEYPNDCYWLKVTGIEEEDDAESKE